MKKHFTLLYIVSTLAYQQAMAQSTINGLGAAGHFATNPNTQYVGWDNNNSGASL